MAKSHWNRMTSASAYLSVNATSASLLSALTKMAEDFTCKNKRELHVPLIIFIIQLHRQNKQYFNLVKKKNKLNQTNGIIKHTLRWNNNCCHIKCAVSVCISHPLMHLMFTTVRENNTQCSSQSFLYVITIQFELLYTPCVPASHYAPPVLLARCNTRGNYPWQEGKFS